MKAGGSGWRLKPEFAVRLAIPARKVKNGLFLEWINGRLPAIPTGVLVVIYAFEQSTKSIGEKHEKKCGKNAACQAGRVDH